MPWEWGALPQEGRQPPPPMCGSPAAALCAVWAALPLHRERHRRPRHIESGRRPEAAQPEGRHPPAQGLTRGDEGRLPGSPRRQPRSGAATHGRQEAAGLAGPDETPSPPLACLTTFRQELHTDRHDARALRHTRDAPACRGWKQSHRSSSGRLAQAEPSRAGCGPRGAER